MYQKQRNQNLSEIKGCKVGNTTYIKETKCMVLGLLESYNNNHIVS